MEKNKKAAMEMSVGTMVTIVLLMVVLVLGIFFVQRIFSAGENAIDSIDNQVQSEIQKLFSNENTKIAFFPTSRDVIIKKGDTKGFAFSVRNQDVEDEVFNYVTTATDASKCGSSFNEENAQNMLLGGSGTLNVGPGETSDIRLVRFIVPESAPPCTIEYQIKVTKGQITHSDLNFFLIIK